MANKRASTFAVPALPQRHKIYDIDFILRKTFGKKKFRPMQHDVVLAALAGKDVYLQAATSFGKSLCFQLPAVANHGITIVISPLLSLMQNQVDSLKSRGIRTETINGSTSRDERDLIRKDMLCGHPTIKMLYVTPELCALDWFRNLLDKVQRHGQLNRFVIDEAHCISQWGHDFRRSYIQLSIFRERYPTVPIFCATATATASVKNDIINTLGLDKNCVSFFSMSTYRPNLHFEIVFKSGMHNERYLDLRRWLRAIYDRRRQPVRKMELAKMGERIENISGIIYVFSRDKCMEIATKLQKDGIGAMPYHAKLKPEVKEETLTRWVENQVGYDIIVATTAFGMGIDKEDVRFVVHWEVPKSFEGYYQEAGRAGRDGKASACRLYFADEDAEFMTCLVEQTAAKNKQKSNVARMENHEGRKKSLSTLISYCQRTDECRHKLIGEYFGDEGEPACDYACDWHKDANDLKQRKKQYDDERRGMMLEEGLFEMWTQATQQRLDAIGDDEIGQD